MDEILFKGIKKDKKIKPRYFFKIKNKPIDYKISDKFKKEFQNIINFFIENKLSFSIQNYYSNTKFEDIKYVLDKLNFDYSENINFIKYEDKYIKFDDKDEDISITFLYRYSTINGTSNKLKHLLLDQLVCPNSIIWCKDKQILEEKYSDYHFIYRIDKQFDCDKLILYDIPDDFFKLLGFLEWKNGIQVVCIYIDEEQNIIEKIKLL